VAISPMKRNFKQEDKPISTVANNMKAICIITVVFQAFRLLIIFLQRTFKLIQPFKFNSFHFINVVNECIVTLCPGSFEPGQ